MDKGLGDSEEPKIIKLGRTWPLRRMAPIYLVQLRQEKIIIQKTLNETIPAKGMERY